MKTHFMLYIIQSRLLPLKLLSDPMMLVCLRRDILSSGVFRRDGRVVLCQACINTSHCNDEMGREEKTHPPRLCAVQRPVSARLWRLCRGPVWERQISADPRYIATEKARKKGQGGSEGKLRRRKGQRVRFQECVRERARGGPHDQLRRNALTVCA